MKTINTEQPTSRRQFLKSLGVGTAAITLGPSLIGCPGGRVQKGAGSRPNILFIMSDDHAANAISAYGGRYSEWVKTPNIDRIAREGAHLTHVFCTNSICTPSRACIMTGQYSHVNGVYTLRDDFDRDRPNVAKMLRSAGYQTAIVGKWHLHTEPSGFDYYNVLPGQGLYHNPLLKEKGKPWQNERGGGEGYEGYATDVITDVALTWLKNRESDQPFFLMCHHKAPHGLWEYAERHRDLFRNMDFPEPPGLFEDKSHRSEATRNRGRDMLNMAGRMHHHKPDREWPTGKLDTTGMTDEEKSRAAYQKYLKDYMRCVTAIDENVGRLLEYLDENDLTNNTIVIYTSDQGMFLGEHAYYDKRWMFEEALQMPFLIRYPGEIRAGSVNDDVIINADFAPMFLDFAGLESPSDMQGCSFRANLQGRTPSDWRDAMYYRYWMHKKNSEVPAHFGVRTRRFKLIFFYGLALGRKGADEGWRTVPGWELYDLEKDPLELNNVYRDPAYREAIPELKRQLRQIRSRLGDTDENHPEINDLMKAYA